MSATDPELYIDVYANQSRTVALLACLLVQGKLARRSFDLHEQLGESLGQEHDFGYRKLDTLALVIEERKKNKKRDHQIRFGRVCSDGNTDCIVFWISASVFVFLWRFAALRGC